MVQAVQALPDSLSVWVSPQEGQQAIPWHLTFPVINFSWHLSDSNTSSVVLQGWVLFMESEHSPSEGRYLFSFFPPLSSAEKSRQGKPERRGAKLHQRPKNTDAGFRVTGVFRRSQKLAQEAATLSSFLCGASLSMKSCGFLPYPWQSTEVHVREPDPWMLNVFSSPRVSCPLPIAKEGVIKP